LHTIRIFLTEDWTPGDPYSWIIFVAVVPVFACVCVCMHACMYVCMFVFFTIQVTYNITSCWENAYKNFIFVNRMYYKTSLLLHGHNLSLVRFCGFPVLLTQDWNLLSSMNLYLNFLGILCMWHKIT
jgi:hypothetical protein